jgi:YHS domain-containing protein
MAAALWHGGISFGGVISFIFADLIAFPLVLIYRKYYGTKLALKLFFTFWAVMAAAGLIVEVIFDGLNLIPETRPHDIVHTGFEWNYTTFLNIAFLGVFAVLYWLYRNRDRLGGGQGYALDPVCGMQVRTSDAPATRQHDGHTYFFCADRCAERFDHNPDRFVRQPTAGSQSDREDDDMAIDPICGMTVDPASAAAVRTHEGRNYFFCAPGCATTFDSDPGRYATATSTEQSH